MAIVRKTLAQARQSARVDHAKLNATTQTDIERQAREDGTDDFQLFPPSAADVRKKLGMTQPEIAALLRMPLSTWRNWEQGRTAVDAAGCALLVVLEKEPAAVQRALGKPA